jgi:hypothetical protein
VPFLVVANVMQVLIDRARVCDPYISWSVLQAAAVDVAVMLPIRTSRVTEDRRYPSSAWSLASQCTYSGFVFTNELASLEEIDIVLAGIFSSPRMRSSI